MPFDVLSAIHPANLRTGESDYDASVTSDVFKNMDGPRGTWTENDKPLPTPGEFSESIGGTNYVRTEDYRGFECALAARLRVCTLALKVQYAAFNHRERRDATIEP